MAFCYELIAFHCLCVLVVYVEICHYSDPDDGIRTVHDPQVLAHRKHFVSSHINLPWFDVGIACKGTPEEGSCMCYCCKSSLFIGYSKNV
ncbi:unnamed protein product [Hermetia illucens]|uniref:Secreted protein n=1 Tax=Hermetia illucens TaxID=343691 RepID=A0A7R8USL0_HERIL|nr:unnamed protein product [Hermetia illucens]